MKIEIINILFVLDKSKTNTKGYAPIRCRITYKGIRKVFSSGLLIKLENWNNTFQQANPPNKENKHLNSQLSLIKNNINQAFLFLQNHLEDFTADDIYNQYAGLNLNSQKSILEVFTIHIQKQEKLVGIATTEVSVAKFRQTQNHLKSFIFNNFRQKDYLLKELKSSFILEFEYYLKAEKKFKQHTIYKTIQRFRQIIKFAIVSDYMDKDPFLLHRNPKPKNEIVFLTPEELRNLEEYKFSSVRLQQVTDMFVFCCYILVAFLELLGVLLGVPIKILKSTIRCTNRCTILSSGVSFLKN